MEIIKSNSGADKVCMNGFMYTKKHEGKTEITWHCVERNSIKSLGH